jgi:hypothetical protein
MEKILYRTLERMRRKVRHEDRRKRPESSEL